MNIYEKINAIMDSVENLKKDGKVDFGNTKYKFLSEAKTTAEMRKQLIKYKLVIFPIGVEEKKEGQITHGIYTYKLINAENPEEYMMLQSSGQGHDSTDKGSGKASSYAYKYLMWRMFAIPSNDDPDQISSEEIDSKKQDAQADMPEKEKVDESQKITKAHIDFVNNTLKSTGSDVESFLAYMEIEKVEDMTLGEFVGKGKPALDKKLKAKK